MNLLGAGGAVSIRTDAEGFVDVEVKGRLSAAEVMSVVEVAWYGRRKPRPGSYTALVVNLRAADIPDLRAVLEAGGQYGPVVSAARELPAALVLADSMMDAARAYCLRAAMLGVVAGAFTEPGKARQWVMQRAAALQEQRRMRSLARLPRKHGDAALGP